MNIDDPVTLDSHHGMTPQKATDIRRLSAEVRANEEDLQTRLANQLGFDGDIVQIEDFPHTRVLVRSPLSSQNRQAVPLRAIMPASREGGSTPKDRACRILP